jgi:signal transduction histidine kinase
MTSVLDVRKLPSVCAPDRIADVGLAGGALAVSILFALHGSFVSRPSSDDISALTAILLCCSTLPLVWWRRAPLGVFVATGLANVVLAISVYPIGLPVGPALGLYLLAAHRSDASVPVARIVAASTILLFAYVVAAGVTEATIPGYELVHAGLLWAVAWFAGERARLRHEQIVELKREAQRERLLAAAEERARIARDLHDSAGHAINVIAIKAGAARLGHQKNPEGALPALASIEELARRTADEIDHIVGGLRDRRASDLVEPPHGLASLRSLLAQHTSAGLEVLCTTTGTARPLGRTVDQAAYRILQEALTNASRHGAGSAHVDIAYSDALELRVTNPVGTECRDSNGGHGIVGMRERAGLLGGDLRVERNDGGFTVRARLPYGAHQR